MFARKENKEYVVDNYTKDIYLKEGYDIYDKNGEVIEYSPKKQVSLEEYVKLEKKFKELTAKSEELAAELEEANNSSNDKELTKANKTLEKKVKELTDAKEKLEAKVEELTAKSGDEND